MRRIVVLGKGGIGKSTVVANVAVLFQRHGARVLQVGCDPKHDSYLKHADEGTVETVMNRFASLGRMNGPELERLVVPGRTGVHVLEAGGPEPGRGCAGRAVSLMLDLLNEYTAIYDRYDVVLYDVLGDVVCGGFAAPLRETHEADVLLVASAEYMSLYAANNIARGLRNLAGIGAARLIGVVANRVRVPADRELVEHVAARLGTRVLGAIPYSDSVARADAFGTTIAEEGGANVVLDAYAELFHALATASARCIPTPLDDAELKRLVFDARYHPGATAAAEDPT